MKGHKQISNLKLEDSPEGRPQKGQLGMKPMVQAVFKFETPRALGTGFVLIPFDAEAELREDSPPKASLLFMMVSDWKGHNELGFESGLYDGHNLSWEDVRKERRDAIEGDPAVIISESLWTSRGSKTSTNK